MAKKDEKLQKGFTKSITSILGNLTGLSKDTNYSTYGTTKDFYGSDNLLAKMDEISKKDEGNLTSTIKGSVFNNSRINGFGLTGSNRPMEKVGNTNIMAKSDSIYDIVANNKSLYVELKNQMLMNEKRYDTIGDYEVLRRAVPQVSRVIDLIINSILTPEAIAAELFNLEYKIEDKAKAEIAKKIREKYELDAKLRTIVENYLVIGSEFITVVPYRAIIEAIKQDKLGQGKKNLVRESALIEFKDGTKPEFITESAIMDTVTEELRKKIDKNRTVRKEYDIPEADELNKDIAEHMSNLKVYKTNRKLAWDAAFVESVTHDDGFLLESSFKDVLKSDGIFKNVDKVTPKSTKDYTGGAAEGLIDTTKNKAYDEINIRGCKIERLDPTKLFPLRIKDTIIAYIYIEERRDDYLALSLRGNMQNQYSFYRFHQSDYNEQAFKMIENRILNSIGNAVLSNISPKFIEANFDDMDVFYEFLRDRQIHKMSRDIIVMHPDDVFPFIRQGGSIMKNALFFLKLYLLLVLSNILTKVRKGSDRTLWYVNNGLSNDIEGAVTQAIEAVQQSQIRFSDVGTISGIIGAVGSVVDLFVPKSQDGEVPISPEIVQGQQVDMDDEFLKFLMNSIILSFGIPSVVVDYTNEVEFAKTLSMANLDVASSSAHAQAELNPVLTRMVRRVFAYELELTEEEVESVFATLIPSRSMLMQITNEMLNTIKDLAQSFADLEILGDNVELDKQIFMRNFVRDNLNYDWASIDKNKSTIKEGSVEQSLLQAVQKAVNDALGDNAPTDANNGDGGNIEATDSGTGGF